MLSEDIFTTLDIFVMIRVPVTIAMPSAIEKLNEARVSTRSTDQFMQLNMFSNRHEKVENEIEDGIIM